MREKCILIRIIRSPIDCITVIGKKEATSDCAVTHAGIKNLTLGSQASFAVVLFCDCMTSSSSHHFTILSINEVPWISGVLG